MNQSTYSRVAYSTWSRSFHGSALVQASGPDTQVVVPIPDQVDGDQQDWTSRIRQHPVQPFHLIAAVMVREDRVGEMTARLDELATRAPTEGTGLSSLTAAANPSFPISRRKDCLG